MFIKNLELGCFRHAQNDKSVFTFQRTLLANSINHEIYYFQTFSSKNLDFYIVSFLISILTKKGLLKKESNRKVFKSNSMVMKALIILLQQLHDH